jgi:hypothetical protein
MAAVMQRIQILCEQIVKEAFDADIPNLEACHNVLKELEQESKENVSLEILEKSKIAKLLAKSIRGFKRHKRTANEEETKEWESVIKYASQLMERWKGGAENEATEISKKEPKTPSYSSEPGLPHNAAEYRMRLVVQKKEIFKDPPVMPPLSIEVQDETCPFPQRDGKTGLLTFTANDPGVKQMLKDFQPNRTPEEILRAGSFGGTYFRPITSAVTNISYKAQDVLKATLNEAWIKGLPMNMLTSTAYRPQINKFGVKCGGSLGKLHFALWLSCTTTRATTTVLPVILGMWESSGWIVESDPYGWFQWYCRFYQGRRCSDDARQITRYVSDDALQNAMKKRLLISLQP